MNAVILIAIIWIAPAAILACVFLFTLLKQGEAKTERCETRRYIIVNLRTPRGRYLYEVYRTVKLADKLSRDLNLSQRR
jgi:hypothetical protein